MTLQRCFAVQLACLAAVLCGCSADAGTRGIAPDAAIVGEPVVAKDPSRPVYVLAVEPYFPPMSRNQYGCEQYGGPEVLLSSAILNALTKVGNFSLLDHRPGSSLSGVTLSAGERGPFIVRVSPSEYAEGVERKERGTGSLRPDRSDSPVTMLGKVALMIPGFWVTQLTGLPTSWNEEEVSGVVALEVSVLDPRTKQILSSFPARGSFKAKRKEIGDGIFGYYSKEEVRSPVETAVRAAMNDAAKKLLEHLGKR